MGLSQGIPVTFPSGALTLEGLVHLADSRPAPGVVICHPHPQYGGDMYNNVVEALVRASLAAGGVAVRFNFRGIGGSEGSYDNGAGEQADAAAALTYARSLSEVDAARVAIAGYSFGAAVALATAMTQPELSALLCVSAPTIGGYLQQPDLQCPVLFVSGDRDQYSDTEELARLVQPIGNRAELAVMKGVDHFWWGSDDRLVEATTGFLARTLGAPAHSGG